MDFSRRGKKKEKEITHWSFICMKSFIIYLIILKSNSNSSKHMTFHCMQIEIQLKLCRIWFGCLDI